MTIPKPVTMNDSQFLAPTLRSTMFEGNSWQASAVQPTHGHRDSQR
jgi:hypothetical protein